LSYFFNDDLHVLISVGSLKEHEQVYSEDQNICYFKDAMHLLTKFIYMLLFNHTEAVNPTTVNIKKLPNSYPCMLKYYKKTTLLKKCGPQIWH